MKQYIVTGCDVKFNGAILKEGTTVSLSDADAAVIGKYVQPVGVPVAQPQDTTGGGEQSTGAVDDTAPEQEAPADQQAAAGTAEVKADSTTTNKKGKQ